MSRKVERIQKYLKKLHNKQSNIIFSVKKNILSQIQNNKTGLESNHKDKQYIELFGKLHEIDSELITILNKRVENIEKDPIYDINDKELNDGLESYKKNINDAIMAIKQSYGYGKMTDDNVLDETIKKIEKKIIAFKVLIKENKKELANIDDQIEKTVEQEEKILSDEVARILNKMEDENNELYGTLYKEYGKKIDMEKRLKDAQERYNKLSEQYKSAKLHGVKSNKSIKSSLDNKKEIQRKYNKDSYLLNSQLDGITKDKEDLNKLINGDGHMNKARLQRRYQQLLDEEELVKSQKSEIHKKYMNDIEKFQSVGGPQEYIKIKREIEALNNHIKGIKHSINNFSSMYINPIYDAYITRTLALIEQFNCAKERREKIDERTNETRNETIEKCSKMITSYGNKIIECNNKIKELMDNEKKKDSHLAFQIKNVQWYSNMIKDTIQLIDEFIKNRTEINSLS